MERGLTAAQLLGVLVYFEELDFGNWLVRRLETAHILDGECYPSEQLKWLKPKPTVKIGPLCCW